MLLPAWLCLIFSHSERAELKKEQCKAVLGESWLRTLKVTEQSSVTLKVAALEQFICKFGVVLNSLCCEPTSR